MQSALRKKQHDILVVSAVDDDDMLDLHEPVLDRDFVFTARVHSTSTAHDVARCVVVATPFHLSDAPDADTSDPGHREHLDEYSTHRNFQRLFNLHLRDAKTRDNLVIFSITHPLLADAVHSDVLGARALELFTDMRVPSRFPETWAFSCPYTATPACTSRFT